MNEDDLKWVANKKGYFLRQVHENSRSKTTTCRKLINFSEMQDDALMHREDFKPSRCIKASFYLSSNIFNFSTTKGFIKIISMNWFTN